MVGHVNLNNKKMPVSEHHGNPPVPTLLQNLKVGSPYRPKPFNHSSKRILPLTNQPLMLVPILPTIARIHLPDIPTLMAMFMPVFRSIIAEKLPLEVNPVRPLLLASAVIVYMQFGSRPDRALGGVLLLIGVYGLGSCCL